jgi:hypothetical protein
VGVFSRSGGIRPGTVPAQAASAQAWALSPVKAASAQAWAFSPLRRHPPRRGRFPPLNEASAQACSSTTAERGFAREHRGQVPPSRHRRARRPLLRRNRTASSRNSRAGARPPHKKTNVFAGTFCNFVTFS